VLYNCGGLTPDYRCMLQFRISYGDLNKKINHSLWSHRFDEEHDRVRDTKICSKMKVFGIIAIAYWGSVYDCMKSACGNKCIHQSFVENCHHIINTVWVGCIAHLFVLSLIPFRTVSCVSLWQSRNMTKLSLNRLLSWLEFDIYKYFTRHSTSNECIVLIN
jgi:hypothetical protein